MRFVYNTLFPCTLGYQENKITGYTALLSFQQRNYWNISRPFLFHGATAPSGASPSQSDTPHSVGLLYKSDQPVAETST